MDVIDYHLSPYCPVCDNRLGGRSDKVGGLYCFTAGCSFNAKRKKTQAEALPEAAAEDEPSYDQVG